jgi:CO dehydrogenase maturation factor
MRIAFVGKGGVGKSTITSLFAVFLLKNTNKPIVLVDADLNIHAPELLGLGKFPLEKYLSHPAAVKIIKKWLIGENSITDLGAFRKTTPPTRKSNIIYIDKLEETPLYQFALIDKNLFVFAVGTYQEDEIGASCYHNNLSIFESILNHLDDKSGYVIADMVAGTDSFAGTLHMQFDLTCFIVEPTKKSIEVYNDYQNLAKKAGVFENLIVLGNKVRDSIDENFLKKEIPDNKYFGSFFDDMHIHEVDKTGEKIDIDKLNPKNKQLLEKIFKKLNSLPDSRNKRLSKLYELHKKYVAQAFVKDRFVDLTDQIDPDFKFE